MEFENNVLICSKKYTRFKFKVVSQQGELFYVQKENKKYCIQDIEDSTRKLEIPRKVYEENFRIIDYNKLNVLLPIKLEYRMEVFNRPLNWWNVIKNIKAGDTILLRRDKNEYGENYQKALIVDSELANNRLLFNVKLEVSTLL